MSGIGPIVTIGDIVPPTPTEQFEAATGYAPKWLATGASLTPLIGTGTLVLAAGATINNVGDDAAKMTRTDHDMGTAEEFLFPSSSSRAELTDTDLLKPNGVSYVILVTLQRDPMAVPGGQIAGAVDGTHGIELAQAGTVGTPTARLEDSSANVVALALTSATRDQRLDTGLYTTVALGLFPSDTQGGAKPNGTAYLSTPYATTDAELPPNSLDAPSAVFTLGQVRTSSMTGSRIAHAVVLEGAGIDAMAGLSNFQQFVSAADRFLCNESGRAAERDTWTKVSFTGAFNSGVGLFSVPAASRPIVTDLFVIPPFSDDTTFSFSLGILTVLKGIGTFYNSIGCQATVSSSATVTTSSLVGLNLGQPGEVIFVQTDDSRTVSGTILDISPLITANAQLLPVDGGAQPEIALAFSHDQGANRDLTFSASTAALFNHQAGGRPN